MATAKVKTQVTPPDNTPTEKINLFDRLSKIKYGDNFPTAKSVVQASKSTRGPTSRVNKFSGLQTIKNTLGKQNSKSDLSDLLS